MTHPELVDELVEGFTGQRELGLGPAEPLVDLTDRPVPRVDGDVSSRAVHRPAVVGHPQRLADLLVRSGRERRQLEKKKQRLFYDGLQMEAAAVQHLPSAEISPKSEQ